MAFRRVLCFVHTSQRGKISLDLVSIRWALGTAAGGGASGKGSGWLHNHSLFPAPERSQALPVVTKATKGRVKTSSCQMHLQRFLTSDWLQTIQPWDLGHYRICVISVFRRQLQDLQRWHKLSLQEMSVSIFHVLHLCFQLSKHFLCFQVATAKAKQIQAFSSVI